MQQIFDLDEDDLNISGDIFSDFNEDIESSKIFEDERFYRYGRFYSLAMSMGMLILAGTA